MTTSASSSAAVKAHVDDHVPSSEERRGRELGFDPTAAGTGMNVLGIRSRSR